MWGADNTVINSFTYTLDNTGRRRNILEADGRESAYDYDELYRLVSEDIVDPDNGHHSARFEYDWVGNRVYENVNGVQSAYTYDSNDRLQQSGGSTYTYDNNGNTLSETLEGNTKSYTYNALNQLTGLDANGNSINFAYNPSGIRVGKTEGGITTSYLVDSNRDYAQVLLEENGSEQILYTYGHDLINQDRSEGLYFYLYDGLGSTRALVDELGQVTDTYDYEAFGELLNQNGTTPNSYLFAGEQFDGSLNQYYLRARYYDQGIGRFTQMDSWMGDRTNAITLNKYLYANADPGNNTDPSGNITLSEINASLNVMARLTTQASASFVRGQVGQGWRAVKQLGDTGEKVVKQIIQDCIRPSDLRRGRALGSGSRRRLDFELFDEAGSVIHSIEAKAKVPHRGSVALRRLADQLLDAQATGRNVSLVGGQRVSDKHLKNSIEYLRGRGVDISSVEIFNGFVEFARWGAAIYFEECFETF